MTLLAYVGLRPQEALSAVWSDIAGGKLVVDAAKTGRTRVVPLLPVVRAELAELRMREGRPGPAAPIIATDAGERGVRAAFGRSGGIGGRRSHRGCGRTICATPTCR